MPERHPYQTFLTSFSAHLNDPYYERLASPEKKSYIQALRRLLQEDLSLPLSVRNRIDRDLLEALFRVDELILFEWTAKNSRK